MGIMKLKPAAKDYIWGGKKLKTDYNKISELEKIAETWECSVHPDGTSAVVTGAHAGIPLDRVIAENPEYKGRNNGGGFPVLIKLIDAEKNLSVQVHPNDEYARIHENQNGKTEMWYVLEAEENASLIYGFENEYSAEEIIQAVKNGKIMEYLHRVPVKKGDVFYIPAGTVHAIGAGAVIAEIQENSNVTYRVYDYDRKDSNGKKRELHIEKALEVMDIKPAPAVNISREKFSGNGYFSEILCTCNYFETEKISIIHDYGFSVGNDSFQVLLCIDGKGTVSDDTQTISFIKGDCIFISAGTGEVTVNGKSDFIKVKC